MPYLTEPVASQDSVIEVKYPNVHLHLPPSTSTSVCSSFLSLLFLFFPFSKAPCSLCVAKLSEKNFGNILCWHFYYNCLLLLFSSHKMFSTFRFKLYQKSSVKWIFNGTVFFFVQPIYCAEG